MQFDPEDIIDLCTMKALEDSLYKHFLEKQHSGLWLVRRTYFMKRVYCFKCKGLETQWPKASFFVLCGCHLGKSEILTVEEARVRALI